MSNSDIVASLTRLREIYSEDYWNDPVVFPALLEILPCLHFSKPPRETSPTGYLSVDPEEDICTDPQFADYGTLDAVIIPTYVRENYIAPIKQEVDRLGFCRVGVVYGETCELSQIAPKFDDDRYLFIGLNEFLRHKLQAPDLLKISELVFALAQRASAYPLLADWMNAHSSIVLTLLVRNTIFVRQFRKFQEATGVRHVLSSNEQAFPNAMFHWNAGATGVNTSVVFHGFPTRLYAPLFSNRAVVTDPAHIATFEAWGEDPNRFSLSNNPESADALNLADRVGATGGLGAVTERCQRELLFLSQVQGRRIWNIQWFEECVELLETYFRRGRGNNDWKLRVRFHPHDNADERQRVCNRFAFLKGRFVVDEYDLSISSYFATAAITCSSTGISMAYALGRKCAFLWHPQMNALHGEKLLDGVPHVGSLEELEEFLR